MKKAFIPTKSGKANKPVAYLAGFTLIEILVVILIIGILAAIIVYAMANAKMNARDATRKNDLDKIRTALLTFYSDQNPNSFATSTAATTADTKIFGGSNEVYLNPVPAEPIVGRHPYQYQTDTDPSQSFVVSCDLENNNDGDRNTSAPKGLSLTEGYDFWVSNE
jgi:prepilin-type N-terminal cleavage/methylation domain-containing protein